MSEDTITRELTIAIRKADRRYEASGMGGTKLYAEVLRSEMRDRGLSLTLTGDATPEETRAVLLGALREHAEAPLEGEQPTSRYSPPGHRLRWVDRRAPGYPVRAWLHQGPETRSACLITQPEVSMNKYERMDLIRARIVALPGKTLRRWQDGDERCHCTHCYLCGELYRTADIDTHERECQEALLKVLEPAAPARPEPRPNPVDELTRVTEEIGGYEWQCQACKGTGKAPARPEAMTEDRPADLYEAHINTHVFKAPTYEGVQFTNCDRCGEQYGARYTRLCPVVVSEPAGPPSDTVPGDIRCRVTGKPRCQCVGCWPNWPNPH